MRTSGAASEFPFVISVLVIAVLVVVFVAGGPSVVLHDLNAYLKAAVEATVEFIARVMG